MTVAELIAELSKMHPDSSVTIDAGSYVWSIVSVDPGDYGDVTILCEYAS